MNYTNKFKNIKLSTIGLTHALFSPEFFKKSDADKQSQMKDWLSAASALYGVVQPDLVISNEEDVCEDGGQYYAENWHGTIVLPKYSVVSLLHEFRHHLQADGKAHRSFRDSEDREHDARGWSLSLLRAARPSMLKQSVRKGYIMFVEPEHLA